MKSDKYYKLTVLIGHDGHTGSWTEDVDYLPGEGVTREQSMLAWLRARAAAIVDNAYGNLENIKRLRKGMPDD